MTEKKKSFAVFDIDGTLIRWQLYHAVADTMVKQGIIDKQKYASVIEARNNWKSRRSNDSFNQYEASLVKLIDKTIVGVDYEQFIKLCEDVMLRYKDQVYTFTRDLIAKLKERDYLTFAISASPSELVSLVAAYYKFDDYGASDYEIVHGKFTGAKRILYGPAKLAKLQELVTKHQATMHGSVAVGDTEGDIDMLMKTELPIAFNPSDKLFTHAQERHWQIVVERKNVVYRLEYDHGRYILTPAKS